MLAFATACLLLIITPGPGVLSVAGVGSGFGFRAGSSFLWGLCLGNASVAILVASGVAATVLAIPVLREVLLVLSICYMGYLALKIAFAGSKVGFIEAKTSPRLFDGFAMQFINPKAYAANTILFSGYNFLPENVWLETGLKFAIWIGIWIPVHFGWLMVGIGLKRLDLPGHIQRMINITMALSMIIVIVLAVFVGN